MRRIELASIVTLTLFLILTSVSAVAQEQVPPRTAGGQALIIPEEHLELGEVYYVAPGVGTQFTWTSDAPLMRITATSNRVIGYVVSPFDFEEDQAPLLAGALRIPVASFSTGSAQYDAEFHGPQALHAEEHPEITFRISQVNDTKLLSDENGRKSYTLNVTGQLTVKETTAQVTVPLRLTMVPFTWQTMQMSLGDFLVLRGRFDVPIADLGLEPPNPASQDFRADMANFDLYLLCSTVSPDKLIDPSVKRENHLAQLQFLTQLRDFNDPEKAYEFGRAYMQKIWDNGPALARLAQATLSEEGIQRRDLTFAAKAVRRANELTESKDPAVLNTLARLHYELGDLPAALKWAGQAVEHLGETPPYVAAEIQAARERYQAEADQQSE